VKPASDRRFRVVIHASKDRATVQVTNPVGQRGAPELVEALRELGDQASAERAFQVRLSAIPGSSAVEASHLGLARIAYETGCSLRAELGEGKVDVFADVALRRRA